MSVAAAARWQRWRIEKFESERSALNVFFSVRLRNVLLTLLNPLSLSLSVYSLRTAAALRPLN